MRKTLTAMLLGAMAAGTAAPALAQDSNAQRIGERLSNRVTDDRDDRRDDRREARQDRREDRREERADRREDRRDDRREWRDDRRDDRRDRWEDRREDWRGYGYRSYGGSNWNRQWTPYGLGYNDGFTRDWVLRNFADRNHNGRISEKEWRRAQTAFYRLADRNGDGYITRFEYDWAQRALRSNYGYRW